MGYRLVPPLVHQVRDDDTWPRDLIDAGAKPTPIYEALFERPIQPGLKLRGRYLERIETRARRAQSLFDSCDSRDYAETGATPHDTEDFIDYPRSIEGVEVALHFIEKRDADIKVSFRARHSTWRRSPNNSAAGGTS